MMKGTNNLIVRVSEYKSKILIYSLYEDGDEVILASLDIPKGRIVAHGDEYKKFAEELGASLLSRCRELWEPTNSFFGLPTIEELVEEIKLRVNALKIDSPNVSTNKKSFVAGHNQKLKEVQGRLRKLLNELDDSESKNDYREAWKWVSILPPR